ncbi:MAG: protein kinase [Kofleriaceae bacterium]|nr:protein kinase [Kofleriaceae bacterium]
MEALRERFGKYHVLEKIAQGGMAEVYKVKTVGIAGFEKVQALKRILPSSAREGRFIRSFIDEARIAVELTHRNIVQVFDFGKADGELFMAMELIEGRDLRTAMTQSVARDFLCPIPVASYVIAEVAAGLDYAHRKTDGYGGTLGIVHCDVSPSNVMLSTDGYVKILDFGIARASFSSALERRRLRGKPRYMAPEQTLGEPPTAQADVFALGIIAWELFTGLPLYRGHDVKSILEAVRRTDPPRVDRMNPSVPKEIVDAIAVALNREPALRGSAADLAAACSRAAMTSGARQLAAWLGELDVRGGSDSMSWTGTPASISVQKASSATPTSSLSASSPPVRLSTRSMTGSIMPAPPALNDFGEGTPGPDVLPPHERTSTAIVEPHHRWSPELTGSVVTALPPVLPPPERAATSEPYRREPTASLSVHALYGVREETSSVIAPPPPYPREPTASVVADPPFGREQTGSVTAAAPFGPLGDPTATRPAPKAFDFDVTTSATRPAPNWGAEHTTEGVGKLQDALDAYDAPKFLPADTAVSPLRPSYERLVPIAGTSPAALRFDDEATQFGISSVGEATSFDELEVESSQELPVDEPVLVDEPIDDDLAALAAPTLSERRRTVVVAAQLEGAERDVLRPVARSLGELAYQRGGVVLRLDDDAVLVAFGLEVAGEDDVAIAMGWALDAATLTRDAGNAEHGGPRLRIGARTGVATSHGGSGDDEPFGGGTTTTRIPHEAIDDARALAREAAPDRPLFVGAAGRVTSGLYELRELPATMSRARIRRGRVIELIGPRSAGDRERARLERRGKFVGRTVQLAELDAWLSRAIAADRRLTALVTGAAGTGKSRLVAELVARRTANGQPLRVIMTAANPASRLAPFALVIELYRAALGLPTARGRAGRAQLVQRLLHLMKEAGAPDARARAVATDLDRAMELRDGVGVGTPEVADLRPRISAGLAAFRAAMADRQRPQLTIIEDVHLADSASLEVLRHALAVTQMGPELLVLTARPEGPQPPAVDVALSVGDLVGGELRTLIADRLGDAATPLNIAAVIARGGGNPLFIEELAQAVREAGDDVPASARDVVAARVDRLTQKAKTALRYAAVLGGAVRARLLEELMGEENLEVELDELVEAGFLVRPEASEGELQFARGLVREVIYESLSARAQRENHARVGRLLASRFFAGREEPPAVIAEHMERGGELAAAAAFWLRAGKLAVAASDASSAIAQFSRVIAIERELGPVPPTAPSRARRREAFAGREESRRMLGDLVTDASDLDELARLAGGEPRRLADVAIRRAHRALRLGDYGAANVATVVAEDHAIAIDDLRLRGEALRVRSEILERLGRFDEALVVVEDARSLFAREGAVADEMAAMVGTGRIHLMRAHYEAARAAYRPAIHRIEKTGDPWLERIVQNHVAIIEMCLGNFGIAMHSAQRCLELCRRYGDRAREGDALSVAGIILLEVGLYDQAAATFGEALELLSRTASRWSRADCMIYAGVCDVRRGRDGGIALLDEALAEARRLGARYLEANALISRAGAQLRRGQLAAAADDAADGTAVARAATLVGYEIQGLARHAVAIVRTPGGGHAGVAANLVQRALALLEQQRYLEGSEEEVYANCVEVLIAAGASDRAAAVKAYGRAEVERKLAGLTDPAWRAAYAAIPENQVLLT